MTEGHGDSRVKAQSCANLEDREAGISAKSLIVECAVYKSCEGLSW